MIYIVLCRDLCLKEGMIEMFLFSQNKKRKEERLNRSGNESCDFADNQEDLVIDTADEEISSTKDNDYENPFDDLYQVRNRSTEKQ